MNSLAVVLSSAVVLLVGAPDVLLAIRCHECAVPAMTSSNPPSSWEGCPDDYLDDPNVETCDDGIDYCFWFQWEDDGDKKSMSGCGMSLLEGLPAGGECEDDYQLPGTGTPSGRACVCKSDECNGAEGAAAAAASVVATLGLAVAVGGVYQTLHH